MAKTKAYSLIMIVITVSFLGFCVENIFIAINHGFIDNRNMIFPSLLGYGLAILAYYLLFGTPDKPEFLNREVTFATRWGSTLYCFIIAFIGVSIGEIALGYATEWICDITWWNYSKIPLHITKYTSVPTSLGFATLITFFMKYLFTPLLSFFSRIDTALLGFLSVTLLILLSLDMINSALYMLKTHSTLKLWRVEVKDLSNLILKHTN